MIQIKDKKDCCGCAACAQVCSKGCITMVMDNEGFRYPKIDNAKCIKCGLCDKVCPVLNVEPERAKPQSAHLLQIKDEVIRNESTSGGSFTAIANWVIENGGVVFGAKLHNDNRNWYVQHSGAETKEGLAAFRNSKYVQSDMGESFKEIRQLLKEGRWVLFSGTPCQVEGLHHYFRGKRPERLVLVDVVCYGIPSPGVFRDYMEWKQKEIGGSFKRMLFREKRLCYNYTSFSIFNEQEEKNYHQGVEREQFMRSFFSDMNVRPSCYDCKFKKRYRVSDFTIWDCYDVKEFSRNFDDNGTNRVLVHSELGERLMQDIQPTIREEKYENIEHFIEDEVAMVKSVPMNPRREEFFEDYANMEMGELMQKWFPTTWKVRLNSCLRRTAFKLGVYNEAKRFAKRLLGRKR